LSRRTTIEVSAGHLLQSRICERDEFSRPFEGKLLVLQDCFCSHRVLFPRSPPDSNSFQSPGPLITILLFLLSALHSSFRFLTYLLLLHPFSRSYSCLSLFIFRPRMSRFSGSKTALYARTYGNYPIEEDIGYSEPHTSNIYRFHCEEGRISNYLIQERVRRDIIGPQRLFHIFLTVLSSLGYAELPY